MLEFMGMFSCSCLSPFLCWFVCVGRCVWCLLAQFLSTILVSQESCCFLLFILWRDVPHVCFYLCPSIAMLRIGCCLWVAISTLIHTCPKLAPQHSLKSSHTEISNRKISVYDTSNNCLFRTPTFNVDIPNYVSPKQYKYSVSVILEKEALCCIMYSYVQLNP